MHSKSRVRDSPRNLVSCPVPASMKETADGVVIK